MLLIITELTVEKLNCAKLGFLSSYSGIYVSKHVVNYTLSLESFHNVTPKILAVELHLQQWIQM